MDELRMIVVQASETFKQAQMITFAKAAHILSQQHEWTRHDITRARCMALYHMYLMFYRDPNCRTCQIFLQKITKCYARALKKSQQI